MKRRGWRLILALGFIAAAGGAGYALWTLEARAAQARAAGAAYDAQADRAVAALGELRADLQAYVAAGQQVGFWAPRVSAAVETYRAAVGEMQRATPGDTVAAALTVADELSQLDKRTRELIDGDQALAASDLIFSDGLEMLRSAGAHVTEARQARHDAEDVTLGTLEQQQIYAIGGALGAAALVVVLLLPAGAATATAAREAGAPGLNLRIAPETSDADAQLGAALDARLSEWRSPPEGDRPAPAVDLSAAADLCSDLSRLADPASLPGLLARAAVLLGANGLIIWIADPTGAVLYATAAHGYSTRALARMTSLRREDDNATATAFRTASLQTVKSQGDGTGALVVPLVTVGGCVGVMAVEVAARREQDDSVRALARIVAAQLATLVPAASPAAQPSSEPVARAESR